MTETEEVVQEFLVESHENLDLLDREFVALEADPTARERIATIFRAVHSIKGTCGFVGFTKLGLLAHAGEDLLGRLREGVLALTPEITSALLALVDRIRSYLRAIEATGQEGDHQDEELIVLLEALAERAAPASAPAPVPLAPGFVLAPASPPPPQPSAAPPPPAAPPPVGPSPAAPTAAASDDAHSAASDSTVRVHVGLLDKLMNLVGELVLARNQILQVGARADDPVFAGAAQSLDQITSELQEGVMKTRMQPIGNLWNKLPRVVRDLATTCGKQVRVEMSGQDTELDRTILESIKDPLTHIVRIAVDHGLESAELRALHGKPRTGTVRLCAFHASGQVHIEISDDGGGIDTTAVRDKALQRGLMTAERAARMTEHELCQLVFLPGFSTARQITNVSGRGVGMDVVKTNVDKIGGTVELYSRHGEGTTIKIKIPLTLAIVPALVIGVAGHQFAIPQVCLLELVRVEVRTGHDAIELIHGVPVYRRRGTLLPLVDLRSVLELEPDAAGLAPVLNIVVLQADERAFGLIVDEVRDTEEIVVKPLGKELKGLAVYSGATIMGDGRVTLILDVIGLASHAHGAAVARDATAQAPAVIAADATTQTLLTFRVGATAMAIPLAEVARLEEFPAHQIERSSGRPVVPCRGAILPLIELPAAFGSDDFDSAARPTREVMVYSHDGRSIGFVVDQVLAVVDHDVRLALDAPRSGILGTTLIDGVVTHLLDAEGVIRDHDPGFLSLARHA